MYRFRHFESQWVHQQPSNSITDSPCNFYPFVSLWLERRHQPSILTSPAAPFISTPFAAEIQRTLLHLINTCPSVPACLRSMYSSVLLSWIFMYESTLISEPLYSVCPHFSLTMTSSLISDWRSGRGLTGVNYNQVSIPLQSTNTYGS